MYHEMRRVEFEVLFGHIKLQMAPLVGQARNFMHQS
jgi:hypothetical protein